MMESLFTRYPIFRYVPAVLLLAILFRTSAITGEHMGWLQPPFDKFIHSGAYAALGFCFCFWFKNFRWDANKIRCALVSVLLCVAFGCLDEFHQSFVPGRSVSAGDVVADLIGGIIGASLFIAIKPWKRFKIFR